MDQRVYYGNLNPHALADYLVTAFQQPGYYQAWSPARAQKIVQDEQIYVQIMRDSAWGSGGQKAISVQIVSVAGGISVTMGASDWLNIDETGLAFGLLGALFFPPLLLFPLLQGLAGSGLSHDVWTAIDTYCAQSGAGQGPGPRTHPGFYCTYCGAFNYPGAPRCHTCHAPFDDASAQPAESAASAPPSSKEQPASEQQPQQAGVSESQKTGETRPMFALMTCPNCKATVTHGRFCSNCAVPLPDAAEQKADEEES